MVIDIKYWNVAKLVSVYLETPNAQIDIRARPAEIILRGGFLRPESSFIDPSKRSGGGTRNIVSGKASPLESIITAKSV